MKKILACAILCASLCAQEEEVPSTPAAPATLSPWLTGPLIAPIGNIVGWGDFEIESYVYCTTNTGTYSSTWQAESETNFLSFNPQFVTFWGISSWADITMTPQFFVQTTKNQTSTQFGDLPLGFDFQLYPSTNPDYYPGIKFTIQETFPTGNFQRLDPNKLLTDESGQGTFATKFNMLLYKVYHLSGVHFISLTLSGGYTINMPTEVHGFNTYGGGYGTKGRVLPGNIAQGIFSFELTLTQNWALAMDTVYTHTDRTQFFGTLGTTSTGAPATVGTPSQEQLSFSPAIEYNFSANFGIIIGAWVSAIGRNSEVFRSGVINVDYTY